MPNKINKGEIFNLLQNFRGKIQFKFRILIKIKWEYQFILFFFVIFSGKKTQKYKLLTYYKYLLLFIISKITL